MHLYHLLSRGRLEEKRVWAAALTRAKQPSARALIGARVATDAVPVAVAPIAERPERRAVHRGSLVALEDTVRALVGEATSISLTYTLHCFRGARSADNMVGVGVGELGPAAC